MPCPHCHKYLHTPTCANPACPEDKPEAQRVLILAAMARRQRQEEYEQQWKINYQLSIRQTP